jgi:tetratricopeptide (TPR) repeat protein
MDPKANALGRNAPCPCGSGRRYKDCHGAIQPGTQSSGAGAAATPGLTGGSRISQTMREALIAQREGRISEAAQAYREIIAADPTNFDATHMLSLVEYEIGRYEEALALIKRAIELRPELGIPRQNLRLLESLPAMEDELCREVLPRMRSRLDTGFDVAQLGDGRTVHVVSAFGDEESDALAIVASAAGSQVKLWQPEGSARPHASATPLTTRSYPEGGWLVLLGTNRFAATWLAQSRAQRVLVVATRDDPCAIVDLLDDLAGAGYAHPALLCATAPLARRLGLPPGTVLSEAPVRS